MKLLCQASAFLLVNTLEGVKTSISRRFLYREKAYHAGPRWNWRTLYSMPCSTPVYATYKTMPVSFVNGTMNIVYQLFKNIVHHKLSCIHRIMFSVFLAGSPSSITNYGRGGQGFHLILTPSYVTMIFWVLIKMPRNRKLKLLF